MRRYAVWPAGRRRSFGRARPRQQVRPAARSNRGHRHEYAVFSARIKGQGTARRALAGGKRGCRLRNQEPEASHELQVDGPAVLGMPGGGRPAGRGGGGVAKRRGGEPQPRVGIAGDGPPVRQSSCRHGQYLLLGTGRAERVLPNQPS